MLKDPEDIADVKDRRYDLKPVSWEKCKNRRRKSPTAADVLARLKKILEN